MRVSTYLISGAALLVGACLSFVTATFTATALEDSTEIGVRYAFDDMDLGWAEVQANGLQVILSGTAPSEAERFRAISSAGTVVDASRVIDDMKVTATADLAPPRFSAEILRNDVGISIIGLIPALSDRDAIVERLNDMSSNLPVTDLLETAGYPQPEGWEDALQFGLIALSRLPRSKVSVEAGKVTITANAESARDRQTIEKELNRVTPPGLDVSMAIAAPRPVITPFSLRFLIDETGARFDSCSADDESSKEQILLAAQEAGMKSIGSCTIGLGVPSPNWAKASTQAIEALAELGQGSVTFADADITLVAAQGTDPALFDRVVGELENKLPDVFALHSVLPAPADDPNAGPPEFTATLSPEGQVQIRGRVNSEEIRSLAESFAKSKFGSDKVYTAARVVPDLPLDWPVRVLAGLEALGSLINGSVTVTPDVVIVRGVSHVENARAQVSGHLSDKLGEAENFELDITYRKPPPPKDQPLPPEECESRIATILKEGEITFEPGSATIATASIPTIDKLADLLDNCGDLKIEIQGHTDSQGRESMNQQLSQGRAQSVLNELRSRRVSTKNFKAKGYGEERPIADNKTEEGREANRRIEFHLIRSEPVEESDSTLDAMASDGETQAEPSSEGTTDGQN